MVRNSQNKAAQNLRVKEPSLSFYHQLPAPARSLVATIRGWQLRSWRYGPETEHLVAQALERESWSAQQWNEWQQNQLSFILDRAAKHVPYYREQWAKRRLQGDRASWSYLENWPILEKETIRQNPKAFLVDDCDTRRMKHVHTSGTTGKSIDLWRSRETERQWYALFEARCRNWNGLSRDQRWAIMGGQLVTPVSQRQPPFWVWNASLKQLYFSCYHLSPQFTPHYLDALSRYRVVYLYGYSSALYELAQAVLRLNRRDLQMKVVLTNAEPLFDYQRMAIAEAFRCPVRETYGMAELAAAASECMQGHLHLWPEVAWTEVLSDAKSGKREMGDLLCSGLMNPDMPLIRYRVGDTVSTWQRADEQCDCGRTLPRLGSIEGRFDDLLYTADGRRIGRLDPVFKRGLPIREAQIIQNSLDSLSVRYVPAPGFNHDAAASIVDRLRARMGDVDVTLEEVQEIPRAANGKFRSVICNLPAAVRESLQQKAAV